MPKRQDADSDALNIDESAVAEAPSDEDVRQWARSQRVFISSVMDELADERRRLAQTIRGLGAEPVLFEEFGGREDDPHQAYLSEVASSHIYVGILGRRYGRLLPDRFSATHAEYRHAEQQGLRIAIWIADISDREGHQHAFVEDVRTFHVAPTYRSTDDLIRQVEARLRRIAAEELAPWCKLGPNVFRAHRIVHRRDEITVEATVRSDDVLHALDAMQPDRWGHGTQAQFTWGTKSLPVRVTDVEITTTAARSRTVLLKLTPEELHPDGMLDVTYGQHGPDDLTDVALRTALFGERNPLKDQGLAFAAEMRDPVKPLRSRRLSEEIVRPVAQVLITEALVGAGRADRITRFRLAPAVAGARRVELEWQPRRRHTTDRPSARRVEGTVKLP